ncbi:FKBP-type peptidyl-prolyl cis-trans isomerase [Sphingosinicella sp. BN140058]|nr:FKBP-type peptidyl-prolyl cis-trans isomerase [Sphingosinicella sp. BN140058]
MRMTWLALGGAAIAATAALAQGMEEQPAPQHDTAWHNAQMLYLAGLKPADGWLNGPGGMRYRKVKSGQPGAPHPAPTDVVTIHYAGRLIDGSEFDSSIARGEPATFPLPRLIKGWQLGVPLMAVGDTFEFALPQSLAYGPEGKGPIPGGATLLFTIELIAIPGAEG